MTARIYYRDFELDSGVEGCVHLGLYDDGRARIFTDRPFYATLMGAEGEDVTVKGHASESLIYLPAVLGQDPLNIQHYFQIPEFARIDNQSYSSHSRLLETLQH